MEVDVDWGFGSAEEVVGRDAFSDNRDQPNKVVTEGLNAMVVLNVLAVDVAGLPAGEAVEAVDTLVAAAADGWG